MSLSPVCPVSVDRFATILVEGLLVPMANEDYYAFAGAASGSRWLCDEEFILIVQPDGEAQVFVIDEETFMDKVWRWDGAGWDLIS